ncbi:hypothetical protein HAX54_020309, partial [Datura stramonium]|nr:hypothetical protein [Datura stramonium]
NFSLPREAKAKVRQRLALSLTKRSPLQDNSSLSRSRHEAVEKITKCHFVGTMVHPSQVGATAKGKGKAIDAQEKKRSRMEKGQGSGVPLPSALQAELTPPVEPPSYDTDEELDFRSVMADRPVSKCQRSFREEH